MQQVKHQSLINVPVSKNCKGLSCLKNKFLKSITLTNNKIHYCIVDSLNLPQFLRFFQIVEKLVCLKRGIKLTNVIFNNFKTFTYWKFPVVLQVFNVSRMHCTFLVATLSVVSGLRIGIRRLSKICFGLGMCTKAASEFSQKVFDLSNSIYIFVNLLFICNCKFIILTKQIMRNTKIIGDSLESPWWLIGGFCPEILGPWRGPMKAFCGYVNVDGWET